MQSVIRRLGTGVVDELIVHNDIQATYAEADELAGKRVDRRKKFAIINGELCDLISFTTACSGCASDYEPFGCDECGYTGKRAQSYWLPVSGASRRQAGKGGEQHEAS